MTYATQRDSFDRTRQDLLVVGVRECANHYADVIAQLCMKTEELDDGTYWFPTSVSIAADNATAPDGTTTAETLTFNATNDAIGNVTTDIVTSKAYTGSIWLRVPSGSETVTLRVYNSGVTESGTVQCTVTTTWTRFWVHKLFSGTPVDQAVLGLIRTASDDVTTLEAWGGNLYQNPNDLDKVIKFPYVKQEAVTVNVSTCTASDAGDGSRCYYSRYTCQDPDNFNIGNTYEIDVNLQGIREYRFCRKDTPLPLQGVETRPYLVGLGSAAQEIEEDRAVTVNERITFDFEDDESPGAWNPRQSSDGAAVNTTTTGGTFWRRFVTIYRNYSNPEGYAIRKVGFIEDGVAESDFQTRGRFLIRNMEFSNRKAKMVCGDRLKLTRKNIPAKISDTNTLAATMNNSQTTMVVDDASEISTPGTGYTVVVEIDPDGTSEKVNVTAIDLDTNTLTIQRGRWGTSAAAHTRRVSFREVAEFGTERDTPSNTPLGKNPIDIMIELAYYSGLAASEIDTTTLQSERDTWFPSTVNTAGALSDQGTGTLFRRTLTEQTEVEKLWQEMRDVLLMFMWVNESQMLTGKAYAPKVPTLSVTTITDDANIVQDSVSIDENDEESRVSRVLIAYNLQAGESGDSIEDYSEVRVELDIDAEERSYYGDERLKSILSKWLRAGDTTTAAYFTGHILNRFRHGSRKLSCRLEIKDDDIQLADLIEVDTSHVQDVHGNNLVSRMYVTKKKPSGENLIDIEALDTGLHEPFGFYAGAGLPDYGSADDDDKEYGYYTDDNGFVGTGVPGYQYW